MERDLDALANRRFDVLVIGGGIYGACIARDAALRGLSVALIEKSDFCSGTSHNSLKLIHSGIRYLQHLDFKRVRESITERRIWLSIAPHLVRPLKCVIPTQGYLARGPIALQSGILLHRLLGWDWNRGVPRELRIPTGRVSGRGRLSDYIPGLPLDGLSGAASWYDGQVVDADRVVMECLQSAVERGAAVANYVSADSFMRSNGVVHGAIATDLVGQRQIEISAGITVNAAGPWIQKVLQRSLGGDAGSTVPPLAKNMNIVTRRLLGEDAVGIPSKHSSDAVIGSESRLFFITPWKDVSVIGTTHFPYTGDPDDYCATEEDVLEFIDEINDSYPPAKLTPGDVYYVYSGLTPAESESADGEVARAKHAEIIDHAVRDACEGLVSVIGVKYTTSRLVAERVVSLVQKKLRKEGSGRDGRSARLPGADGGVAGEKSGKLATAHRPEIADLLGRYGTRPPRGVTDHEMDFEKVFVACVEHAVDHEMALNLEDVLLRRSDLAARGKLTESLVRLTANVMSRKLNWSDAESAAREKAMCAAVRYLSTESDGKRASFDRRRSRH